MIPIKTGLEDGRRRVVKNGFKGSLRIGSVYELVVGKQWSYCWIGKAIRRPQRGPNGGRKLDRGCRCPIWSRGPPRHNATISWSLEFANIIEKCPRKCSHIIILPTHIYHYRMGFTSRQPNARQGQTGDKSYFYPPRRRNAEKCFPLAQVDASKAKVLSI